MTAFEHGAIGTTPDEALAREAAEAAGRLDAMSDAYVSGTYRKHLARTLAFRCVVDACRKLVQRTEQ